MCRSGTFAVEVDNRVIPPCGSVPHCVLEYGTRQVTPTLLRFGQRNFDINYSMFPRSANGPPPIRVLMQTGEHVDFIKSFCGWLAGWPCIRRLRNAVAPRGSPRCHEALTSPSRAYWPVGNQSFRGQAASSSLLSKRYPSICGEKDSHSPNVVDTCLIYTQVKFLYFV
jgi:hypothetical protein